MGSAPRNSMGGVLRALAWVVAAMGAAILVTVLFAYRGREIQDKLQDEERKLRERLPQLPELPGLPAPDQAPSADQPPAAGDDAGQPPAPDGRTPAPPAGTDGGAQTPPDRPPTGTYSVDNPPPVAKARHLVGPEDTLYKLAETYYEDGKLWPIIAKANGIEDPSELREGTVIVIPGR